MHGIRWNPKGFLGMRSESKRNIWIWFGHNLESGMATIALLGIRAGTQFRELIKIQRKSFGNTTGGVGPKWSDAHKRMAFWHIAADMT
jgi:hypothetical protein